MRWTFILLSFAPVVILAACFGLSIKAWIEFHNTIGPKVALWSDPFFLHQLRNLSLLYLFIGGMYGGIQWWSLIVVQGIGKTMFSRSAKSMQVGRQLYQVQSALVRRQSYLMRPIFFLSFRAAEVKKTSRPFRSLLYNFRHRESAQKLAEDVAAFLGVPVEK